jgi:hypothetical protein
MISPAIRANCADGNAPCLTPVKRASLSKWLAVSASLLVVFSPGCGKAPEVPVQVRGKVITADGKPVSGLVITFYPQEDVNRQKVPSDLLGKEGTFSVTCLRGRYKVTVAPVPVQGSGMPGAGPDITKTSAKDGNPLSISRPTATTPPEVTISEGGQDDLVLKLTSP